MSSGVAFHQCPKHVALNVMWRTELKAGCDGGERELARECAALGAWVGINGALRSGHVPLMSAPPWD
eukprot:13376265-Alexandrium_andersonii.AAC.1